MADPSSPPETNSPKDCPLDIVCILLSTVINPLSIPFTSGPFPVVDHNNHVYSVSVSSGNSLLSSGSPVDPPTIEYDSEITTADPDCDPSLINLTDLLKQHTEQVIDITITHFVLHFGLLKDQPPILLNCDTSAFQPSDSLRPLVSSIQIISLFLALEASVVPITAECITRGRFCLAGSQSLSRSKIVSVNVRTMVQALNFPEPSFFYIKRQIMTLCPTLMMANAPVCSACFKYYTADPNEHFGDTETNRTRESASLISRQLINRGTIIRPKTTTFLRRSQPISLSHLPIIRGKQADYRIGDITRSGLRITQDRSTIQLELARLVYHQAPFHRPSAVFMRPNSVPHRHTHL
jgi:hypothetical protein